MWRHDYINFESSNLQKEYILWKSILKTFWFDTFEQTHFGLKKQPLKLDLNDMFDVSIGFLKNVFELPQNYSDLSNRVKFFVFISEMILDEN